MLKKSTTEERTILRRVLAHSEKTSRDWYTRPDLTTIGIEAANIIQRLLTCSASEEEADESSPSPSPGKDIADPSKADIHEEAGSNDDDDDDQEADMQSTTEDNTFLVENCYKLQISIKGIYFY